MPVIKLGIIISSSVCWSEGLGDAWLGPRSGRSRREVTAWTTAWAREFLQPSCLLPSLCFKFRELFFFKKHINIHLSGSTIPESGSLFIHTIGAEMYHLFVWTGEILPHVVFNERFLIAGVCADGKPVIRDGAGSCAHNNVCAFFFLIRRRHVITQKRPLSQNSPRTHLGPPHKPPRLPLHLSCSGGKSEVPAVTFCLS